MFSSAVGRAAARHATLPAASSVAAARLALPIRTVVTPLTLRTTLLPAAATVCGVRSFTGSRVVFVARKVAATKAKKSAAASKSKKPAAKKRAAPAKKAAAKKKPAKKPAAPKKRTLTPEQREKRRETARKKKLTEQKKLLREQSLIKEEPRMGLITGFIVFSTERRSSIAGQYGSPSEVTKALAAEWNKLSDGEKARYNATGSQNRETYKRQLEAWINQHSVAQIHQANKARASLKRLGATTKSPIKDSRIPKKYLSPYLFFVVRHAKGMEGGMNKESMTAMAQTWKSMSPSEKKVFEDMAAKDKQRYASEMKSAGLA